MRLLITLAILFTWSEMGILIAQSPFADYQRSIEYYDTNKRDSAYLYAQRAETAYKVAGKPDSALLAAVMVSKCEMIISTLPAAMSTITGALQEYGIRLRDNDLSVLKGIQQRAYVHSNNYQTDSALYYHHQVIDRISWETAQPTAFHSKILSETGFSYMRQRDYNKAKEYTLRSIDLARSLPGTSSEEAAARMSAAHTLCVVYTHTSRYDSALIFGREMLAAVKSYYPPGHTNLGIAHNELGSVFQSLCVYDSAIYHRKKCEEIFYHNYLKEGQARYISLAWGNLGYLYWAMEEYDLSLQYSYKSLQLAEQSYGPDNPVLIYELTGIAETFNAIGKPQKGLPLLHRAYQIQQASGPNEWGSIAYIENFLSKTYLETGQTDSAMHYTKKSLQNFEKAKMGDNKISVNAIAHMGQVLLQKRDTAAAMYHFTQAAERFEKFHPTWHDNVVGMRIRRAQTGRAYSIDSAQHILSNTFAGASLAKSCRTEDCILDSLFNSLSVLSLFREQAQLSLQKHADPLETSRELDLWIRRYERAASRYLGLSRSTTGIRNVAKLNRAVFEAGIVAHYRAWLQNRASMHVDSILAYSTKAKALTLRLNANDRRIASYANIPVQIVDEEKRLLVRIDAAHRQMLQSQIPEHQTAYSDALEEYNAFKKRVQISHPEYHALKYQFDVPSRSTIQTRIENAACFVDFIFADTLLYAIRLTRTSAELLTFRTEEIKTALKEYQASVLSRDFAEHDKASAVLYMALIAPLLDDIDIVKLIVSPDDLLYQVNLESVRIPDTKTYLIEALEVTYTPSADQWTGSKTSHATARRKGMVSFTPGFEQMMKQSYLQIRDTLEVDSLYLTQLSQPFMLALSEALAARYQGSAYFRERATESGFRRAAGDYRLVHFGTHAVIDDDNPLFSRLILAKEAEGEYDGYLHAYEIYGMPIGASLSVLTACETGGGMFQAGLGMQSLAHAFAFAGCPSLIMSLWSIDEKSSASVLERFYDHLGSGIESPVTALTRAKRDYLAQNKGELIHPFYWAGLVYMGSETPVELRSSGPGRYLWVLLIGLGVAGFFIYRSGRKG